MYHFHYLDGGSPHVRLIGNGVLSSIRLWTRHQDIELKSTEHAVVKLRVILFIIITTYFIHICVIIE